MRSVASESFTSPLRRRVAACRRRRGEQLAVRRVAGTSATVVSTSEDPATAPPSMLEVGRQAGSACRARTSSREYVVYATPLHTPKMMQFHSSRVNQSHPRSITDHPATGLMLPDAVQTQGSIETGLRDTFFSILQRSMGY